MTPKQETESRYGIQAPADTPEQAVALPPGGSQPSPVDGGGFGPVSQTEITVRTLARQAEARYWHDIAGWMNQVRAIDELRMGIPYPPKPQPIPLNVSQAKAGGEFIVPWQTFTQGIPLDYQFDPLAWVWFY